MSKLTNIPNINQEELQNVYRFAIEKNENVLVFGPSGAGKTDMAFQAALSVGYKCIYWNMSVMERPDIQGLPALAHDKRTSHFAPQEGMPFVGLNELKQKRALDALIANLSGDSEYKTLLAKAKTISQHLNEREALQSFKVVQNLFDKDDSKKIVALSNKLSVDLASAGNEESKNVLLLDEVDKTSPENLQPLLELLLYKTINGRPLDISCVFMTANLPDEQTYSEPLSHAITARAMVYELVPSSDIWLNWALSNDLHPLVTGFLMNKEHAIELFNKRPINDTLCYAYTSPRAWTACSRVNYKLDEWFRGNDKFTDESSEKMRAKLNASIIGDEAANRIDVWFKYYSRYDSFVQKVFEGSNDSIEKAIETSSHEEGDDEIHIKIVVALALAGKFSHFAKHSDNEKLVHDKIIHVLTWISANVPADIRNMAMRTCYGSGFEKHNLHSNKQVLDMCIGVIEEFNTINKIINKKL